MIRVLIIDDEYLARERIAKLLEPHQYLRVIGQAKNGCQAVELIHEKEPDLIFLDVQMPDFDGFEVIKRLRLKKKPYIVFTTAFDRYAIDAFRVHALDYLLKPIDEDRFNESLEKILEYFNLKKSSGFNEKLRELMKEFAQKDNLYTSSITIKERGREIRVDLDDIYYIEANGNYINLFNGNNTFLYRITMNSFYESLNPDDFMRIHRSYLVNKRYIKHCRYLKNHEYEFQMKNGKKIISGRSYKSVITHFLSS